VRVCRIFRGDDAGALADEVPRPSQLIARKWTYATRRSGRAGILVEIRRLIVRMAEENPTWGYTRIRGALKNLGHHVGRSTIARTLKTHGIPPVPERPT
jgi:putative transposase